MAPERSSKATAFTTAVSTGTVALAACGFFFDFDGTLAPIQDNPATAQPASGIVPRLSTLSTMVGVVAIVSARPVDFLRSRFPDIPDLRFFGLYGLESGHGSGPVHTHPSAAPFVDVMTEVAEKAHRELPAGTVVEHKRLTVALHYRTTPERAEEIARWGQVQRNRYGLRLQAGRMVIELEPPGNRNKGSVLREATASLACAWYFGDDLGDISAFETLADLERRRRDFTAVRVVVSNNETGEQMAKYADVMVATPSDIPRLLDQIVAPVPRYTRSSGEESERSGERRRPGPFG